MVKKRFPPSEYGASYPDLGIASELRPFSLTSGHGGEKGREREGERERERGRGRGRGRGR